MWVIPDKARKVEECGRSKPFIHKDRLKYSPPISETMPKEAWKIRWGFNDADLAIFSRREDMLRAGVTVGGAVVSLDLGAALFSSWSTEAIVLEGYTNMLSWRTSMSPTILLTPIGALLKMACLATAIPCRGADATIEKATFGWLKPDRIIHRLTNLVLV